MKPIIAFILLSFFGGIVFWKKPRAWWTRFLLVMGLILSIGYFYFGFIFY